MALFLFSFFSCIISNDFIGINVQPFVTADFITGKCCRVHLKPAYRKRSDQLATFPILVSLARNNSENCTRAPRVTPFPSSSPPRRLFNHLQSSSIIIIIHVSVISFPPPFVCSLARILSVPHAFLHNIVLATRKFDFLK